MNLNPDYLSLRRAGIPYRAGTYRTEQSSGIIVSCALLAAGVVILLAWIIK